MAQPDTFGRYRVVRRLGSGSFATVWLAHDDLLDTPVAVKVLAENWAHQLDVHQRFVEEARILRQADSAWLVRVHDLDVLADERPFMVMTYADQGSVADLVARGPLPLDEALRLLTEIGQGVTALHRHGTIHRDIKPSNVLLQSSPVGQRVLVADLGFAKSIDGASGFTAAAGTPGYMSPEQSQPGGDIDVRADVYSLGAVAYELVTGRRPPPPPVRVPPRRVRPGTPRALDELIMAALSEDRSARPADAQTFTDRVRAIRMEQELPEGVPWRLRHGAAVRRTAGATAVVAALAACTPAAAAAPGLTFGRVSDTTGSVSVAVPVEWADELQPNGWSPRQLGLVGGREPGLLAATDTDAWHEGGGAAGVFAGLLSRSAPGPQLDEIIDAGPCPGEPRRRDYADSYWGGEVWEWDSCPGPSSFAAAAVRPHGGGPVLYLEVRQPSPRPDIVDQVIAGTRASG
ncbi:serine/threonine-protein kinase [Nocardiopsis sp. RSe5-2]|uniref:non-specific serine/threonine protein kinase n=1 Tax=Nocardiopsis endophytica TaxID=3018445 RepID=A0ABT4U200_9ACTN|nr:serine/threonine-protein kinase [Nocardiopsis endophytica]MDA2810969.1 serine/threonine-protein kinase [Nocardiopsis endophytica]